MFKSDAWQQKSELIKCHDRNKTLSLFNVCHNLFNYSIISWLSFLSNTDINKNFNQYKFNLTKIQSCLYIIKKHVYNNIFGIKEGHILKLFSTV